LITDCGTGVVSDLYSNPSCTRVVAVPLHDTNKEATMTEGNVVQLVIPPKTLSRKYRNTSYVVSFVPATKQWSWKVTFTHVVEHEGDADTQLKAFKAAERFIDKQMGGPIASTAY